MVVNFSLRPPGREREETLGGPQTPVWSLLPHSQKEGVSAALGDSLPQTDGSVGGVVKQGAERRGQASLGDHLRDTAGLGSLPTDLRPASDRPCL